MTGIKMRRKNRPLNIIFDASTLVENMTLEVRGGIYNVAYNVLRQFGKSIYFKTTLLVPTGTVFSNKNKIEIFLSSFPVITLSEFEKSEFHKNIDFHINQIIKTNNFFGIIVRLLKIFKNLIMILAFDKRTKILKNTNVFFSPVYTIPEIIKNYHWIKSFHILHDCIASLGNIPLQNTPDAYDWYSKMIHGLNKDTYYFCVSECTKKDFLKIFPDKLDENKMFVTPNASSNNFVANYDILALKEILNKYGVTQNSDDFYIFSLCSFEPRKNLIFAIKCFLKFIKKHRIYNLYFYLGGGHFPGYISQFNQEISEFSDLQDKIIRLGYIDDEDVNILYSNSLFFTYLSQYEGFGMPPLEAMQAGTPVITSNNSSLPEVVGDAAITITYNDEEACIRAFEDLFFNENLRKEYIAKGLERAKLFSWKKTFKLMSDEILKIVT
jgi:glycosyltransferase involved in cell wall biosynthesis